jgi:hypothetical protein
LVSEIVDQDDEVGSHCSLALNALDQPCITYHDETHGTLRFACLDPSLQDPSWVIETVPDEDLPVGAFSDLIIADGVFHIAYRQGSDVYSSLKYAQLHGGPGGEWVVVEEVDHANQGVGNDLSMAIDSSGYAHISHAERWGQESVRYSRWTGTAWVNETILKEGAEDTAIVMLGDIPRIAIAGGYVGLLRKAGRKWKVEVVDPEGAESVDMVVDMSDGGITLHVVYGTYTDSGIELRHRIWSDAAGWYPTNVVDQSLEYSPDISLALHGTELHLSYYDQMNGDLKYALYDGSWTAVVLDGTSGDAGLYSSIAVGADGTPRVAYYEASAKDLKFATLAKCYIDADCEDENNCTADACVAYQCQHTPVESCCGNGVCEGTPEGEDCLSCPEDCAQWPELPTEDSCGNGICEPVLGEDCVSCSNDCRQEETSGASCGNGVCETADGEDCESCPVDCAGLATGKPSGRFCCGALQGCGDQRCTAGVIHCIEDPADTVPGRCCGESLDDCLDPACTSEGFRCSDGDDYDFCCGDGTCESYEDRSICSTDLDFDSYRQTLTINYEFLYSPTDQGQGVAQVDAGDTLYLYNEPGGWLGYPDIAECRTTCSGQVQAYYHDSLSGLDPGTLGPLVSAGCSRAEEYGYWTVCCIDPAVP